MNKERKLIIAGNWKMNKTAAEALALVGNLKLELAKIREVDIVICPPFTALESVSKVILDSNLRLGAQNMSEQNFGAFTGEICAGMLKEFSVRYVILGHSERRQYFAETDEIVNKKLHTALKHGVVPVVCIGEVLAEREAGKTAHVLKTQIAGAFAGITAEAAGPIVIAYEPVWAIGTGKTATPEMAVDAHKIIRAEVARLLGAEVAAAMRILYGGSVKPDNATALIGQEEIDGALVGGASLKPDSFAAIVKY